MRLAALLALCLSLLVPHAYAETVELDSCFDAAGKAIPGQLDTALPVLVRAGMQVGRRVIRYNPDLLPEVSAGAKQFFFAHECARAAMGARPGSQATLAQARRADCVALSTLRSSGLLGGPNAVPALQAELVFSDEDWSRLPGPRRSFDLPACPAQAGIRLPLAMPPSDGQMEWNSCVRTCGDQLLRCQHKGASEGCQGGYDRCEAACKGR